MNQRISRRNFAGDLAIFAGIAGLGLAAEDKPGFPVVDFHAHPADDVPLEEQVRLAGERGVKLGIPEHAGPAKYEYRHLITTDEELRRWIAKLDPYPVYKGIQAEGLEWPSCFSKEVVALLDYVLSDALTLPEKRGGFTKIWLPGLRIPDKQAWMDRYTEFHEEVMAREPIDILANPLFLPRIIGEEFEALWTEQRMRRIVDAAVRYHVAIEINARYQLPGEKFLRMAKAAGARFSFGSNRQGRDVGTIEYCVEMARKLELTPEQIFTPAPRGRKPIETRRITG